MQRIPPSRPPGDRPPTDVCLTVDTEFSMGALDDRPGFEPIGLPRVLCPADGREQGLGFILDTLDRHGLRASFFVETMNRAFFGDHPMQDVVERLLSAGQDVQLHVHPEWLRLLPDGAGARFAQHGDCHGRSAEELEEVFGIASETFQRWTGRRPDALRTGSLRADLGVYRTLARLGIPLSSSIGLGVFQPREPELQLLGGRCRVEGVLEVPVFTYRDFDLPMFRRYKTLGITSCSAPEMRRLLHQARRAGAGSVVILTHTFEYAKASDYTYTRITRNRVNQERLLDLCRFLVENPAEFRATTFGESRERWISDGEEPEVHLSMPARYAVGRMLHNKLNDLVWAY